MKREILLDGENLNADKKFFSKIGTNYLIFAVAAIIFQIIAINIAGAININLIRDYNTLSIISGICSYVLPFPILVFLMKKLESEKLEKHSLNLKTFIRYIAVTLTLMWIGNIIGLIITTLLSNIASLDIANPVQQLINSTDIWLNLLLISIIGPVFEEFFFRKLLIDRTVKYGAKISILLSALMFGLFHGNLNQFFYAFLMGGFFAYVYMKTGKLIYPILLHIIVNLMGSVVSLFVVMSVGNLTSGTYVAADLAIVIGYLVIMIISFIIGIITLFKYRTAELDNIKAKITLAQPYKTVFLNYGMILFIGFCILEIIHQIIA
jgi:membrane protease YdiL (CAAX protease family)